MLCAKVNICKRLRVYVRFSAYIEERQMARREFPAPSTLMFWLTLKGSPPRLWLEGRFVITPLIHCALMPLAPSELAGS